MWGFSIFAQVGKGSDPFRSPDVIWGTAGLALALLAGALLVYVADRWRKRAIERGMDNSLELTEFRRMFERGEITEEEYTKLRERVARRVKAPQPETGSILLPVSHPVLSDASSVAPNPLPGPDPGQAPPPPDEGKPANPSSPA